MQATWEFACVDFVITVFTHSLQTIRKIVIAADRKAPQFFRGAEPIRWGDVPRRRSRAHGVHARQRVQYEHQEDSERNVRIWGGAAVVTAKLWAKGSDQGQAFDYFVWFSDTYVRTSSGWRYVHGKASLPIPASRSAK